MMNLMDIGGLGGGSGGGGGGGTHYVVKLRGLPWAATKDDILEFFSDCRNRIDGGREGVHLVTGQGGRASGEAFVVPCSDGDLEEFTKNDRKMIGHRYIEVFRVKKSEMEWHVRREKGGGGGGGGRGGGEDSSFGGSGGGGRFGDTADNFVRLRGLPFECSKEDIQAFFEGLSVGSVQLMVDGLGRSTGEAYVEFTGGKGDADRALLKDRATIGHRYIEVFRVGPTEMKSISAMSSPRNNHGGGGPLRNQMNGNNRPRPYSYQGRDQSSGSNNGRGPFSGGSPSSRMPMRYYSKGFEDDYMTESSYGGGNSNWNKPPPPPPPPSYGGISARRSAGGNRPSSASSGGSKDCLLMRGLPYSAGQQEIRKFFEPLVPTEIDVILDSTGRASGTAKVQFGSKDDLTRAMAKHKERMDHRYIELFLHSAHS